MDQRKPFKGQNNQNQNKLTPEKIIIGTSNTFRRNNLLTNASRGLGKAVQSGDHVSYIVGNDREGYIEYIILNATIPTNERK